MKGCMNCGNISCGNNKKRESVGCGRWKAPEEIEKEYKQYEAVISAAQKNLKELEEDYNSKDELFKKIAETEKENERLTVDYETLKLHDEEEIALLKEKIIKVEEIINGLMRFCRCFAQHHTEDIRYKEAEQFLKETE